ncbi:MAG: hypothetical protein AB1426_10170 [Bacillota bacterium]
MAELAPARWPVDLRYLQPPAAGMPLPPPEWQDFVRGEAGVILFSFPLEFKALRRAFRPLER